MSGFFALSNNDSVAFLTKGTLFLVGSKIDIEYESDDYSKVASFSSRFFQKGLGFTIIKESGTNDLYITATRNNHNNDNIIEEFTSFNDYLFVEEVSTEGMIVK